MFDLHFPFHNVEEDSNTQSSFLLIAFKIAENVVEKYHQEDIKDEASYIKVLSKTFIDTYTALMDIIEKETQFVKDNMADVVDEMDYHNKLNKP